MPGSLNFDRTAPPQAMGGWMGMLLPAIAQTYFGSQGMLPGPLQPYQSNFNHYRGLQYQGALNTAMGGMHEQMTERIRSIGSGAMESMGYGPLERSAFMGQNASNMANAWRYVSPIAEGYKPGISDALMGGRGDPQLYAQRMMAYGHRRTDPVTGGMGYTPESVVEMTQMAGDMMYGSNPGDMYGFGMGRVGEMLLAANRRGAGPGGIRSSLNSDDIRALKADPAAGSDILVGKGGASDEQFQQFVSTATTRGGDSAIRQFDAKKTADWAKGMAGTMSALSDMFGPGKPMEQLFDSMNALAQGGMRGMSPDQMQTQIRTFNQLATSSGLSPSEAVMVAGMASQRAMQVGGNRAAGMESAAAGMAWASSFRSSGMEATGKLSGSDLKEMTARSALLAAQAGASAMGLQTGATARISSRYGFAKGSEAEALYEAMTSGQSEYTYNEETKSIYRSSEQEWRDIMVQGAGHAGLTNSVASGIRMQDESNMRAARETPGVTSAQKGAQWETSLAPELRGMLMSQPGGPGRAEADAMMELMHNFKMRAGTKPEDEKLELENQLENMLVTQFGMTPGAAKNMAVLSAGNLQTFARRKGYGDDFDMVLQHHGGVNQGAALAREADTDRGKIAKAFARLGSDDVLGRGVKAVEGGKGWQAIAAAMAGGLTLEERFKGDSEAATAFQALAEEATYVAGQVSAGKKLSPAERTEQDIRLKQLDELARGVGPGSGLEDPKKTTGGGGWGDALKDFWEGVKKATGLGGDDGDPADLAGGGRILTLAGTLTIPGFGAGEVDGTGSNTRTGVNS